MKATEKIEQSFAEKIRERAKQNQRRREWLPLPEWDGDEAGSGGCWIVEMTGKERDVFEHRCDQNRTSDRNRNVLNLRALATIFSACDADGNPIFTEADLVWLSDSPAAPLSKITAASFRVNALTETEQDALVKNS